MSIRACHTKCDWSKCQSYEWFTPGDIKYCWHQVMWLILARDSILPSEGITGYGWPQEPSGYIKQPGKPQPRSSAPFEGYVDVAIVLEQRLRKVTISKTGRNNLDTLDSELKANLKYHQLSKAARSVVVYLTQQRNNAYVYWNNDVETHEKRRRKLTPNKKPIRA